MAKLHFKKFGEGEPLIILHGLYGSSDNWLSIAREFMENFTVYILDLRNHGDSPHLAEHNYQVMIDDLQEFMDDHDIYSSLLMGHSMGGKMAMYYTAYYPERVKKLLIVDMSPRSYKLEKGDRQIVDHLKILDALDSIHLPAINSRAEVDAMLAESITSGRIRQFLLKNLKRNKDKSFVWKINLEVLKNSLPSVLIGLEAEKEALKLFVHPVLFVKGGQSDYIQEADVSMIHELFGNAQIVSIQEASHWVHAEQPELFVKVIKDFIYS